jgi:hypothetical protein
MPWLIAKTTPISSNNNELGGEELQKLGDGDW